MQFETSLSPQLRLELVSSGSSYLLDGKAAPVQGNYSEAGSQFNVIVSKWRHIGAALSELISNCCAVAVDLAERLLE
jgi:hypothetical protein